jgi:hypothetical protein
MAFDNEKAPSVPPELTSNEGNVLRQQSSRVAASSSDPSAPVREFLHHLGGDFEALLPVFVKKGIKDGATLSEFRRMKSENGMAFLMTLKELDDFQLFRLQLSFKDHE